MWTLDTMYYRVEEQNGTGLTLTPMSENIHTSSAVLANLENVGVAFGISLLSCIEAEILR